MVNENTILLPASLLSSDDYQSLSSEQQQGLVARLRHCAEIAQNGISGANEGDSLLAVIDDIELDALSIMSGFPGQENAVTPYKVHSSWTFECDHQAMASYVGVEESRFLQSAALGLAASPPELREWIQRWAHALKSALEHFGNSLSYSESIAHLIVVDALVSSYLVFAAIARLNARLY